MAFDNIRRYLVVQNYKYFELFGFWLLFRVCLLLCFGFLVVVLTCYLVFVNLFGPFCTVVVEETNFVNILFIVNHKITLLEEPNFVNFTGLCGCRCRGAHGFRFFTREPTLRIHVIPHVF